MPNPRASTDEETAPLLDDDRRRNDSFFSALLHPARPLTNLEKILAAGSVLLLILTATFVGLFAGAESALKNRPGSGGPGEVVTITTTAHITATSGHAPSPTGTPSTGVCLSAECIMLSSTILQSLNTSADPCENFVEFATGGWKASHTLPDDKALIGTFMEVDENNKAKIISAIPSKLQDSADVHQQNLHKLKSAYESCMDLDKLSEVGIGPLISLTDKILDMSGPFDTSSSDDAELFNPAEEWRGEWREDYVVPDHLLERLERHELAKHLGTARILHHDHPAELPSEDSKIPVDAERRAKITKTLAWLNSRGASGLVEFQIEGDSGGDDPQMQSLGLYQASGGLPTKEYYEEKAIMDLYHTVVKDILIDVASHTHQSSKRDLTEHLIEAIALKGEEGWPWPWPGKGDEPDDGGRPGRGGSPPSSEPLEERMDRLAAKVVSFERELMRAGADVEKLYNPKYAYNPYSTEKVGKALPFLDIPAYLSTFAIRSFPVNITVTYPPYLESVTRLVDDVSDDVLSGYFVLRLALEYAPALGYDTGVWTATRRLKEALSGLKKGTKEIRQEFCLRQVDSIVGYIAGAEYVAKAFGPDAREDAQNIIDSIIQTFHDHIPDVPWMDKESAKAAQLKAKSIQPRIGYATTPDVVNPQSLANWYRQLNVQDEDFFGTYLSAQLLQQSRTWQTLGRRRDNGTWIMSPQTVNAYYSPPDSEITFPAGILQPPFYSKTFPPHMKYGAFGAVAAHELGHAFDNTGAQYDERGRLRDWWTKETVDAFNERAQCLARQYSKYYILDAEGNKVYVNGNLTNGENIGDAGLSQAFAAWKKSVATKSEDTQKLPGLDFTDEQLFFIAFGRVWADVIRPATAVQRVRSDPHSPNIWRALGTLRNSAEFHKAFGCKSGSFMNPPKDEQCQLWS
ncbi:hypothetical protein BD324DRAFT_584453 [Kockovaella imperatae]|uniref:Endothelin-converting enzyme 1 n=1 Tax=Kockovaella imperatae TaxID=4999 RepID=A0A1Y1U6T1_9TREE|nr:hypothetical protein BD324DRAFT_584453 [Kockovaella imperatae]ORX33753.1 hypothetical protein BD324DRAFT_584453 [Kockovaella imperatae]